MSDELGEDMDQTIDILQRMPGLYSDDPKLQAFIDKFYRLIDQAEEVLNDAIAYMDDEEEQPE